MDVVLLLEGELVVDDKTDLLNIDTSGEEIGGDEDTGGTSSELLHDHVTSHLVHLTMHDGNTEIVLLHLVSQLNNSLFGVAIDQGLVDIEVTVEIEEDVHLPFFFFYGDIVLLDTFEGELLIFNQNLCGIAHKVLGQLQDVHWHGSREEGNLDLARKILEDILDLSLESTREHLVGLVENEDLEVVTLEETLLHHIMYTAWCADNDVNSLLEDLDFITDDGTSNASVDLDANELTNLLNNEGNLLGELSSRGNNKSLGVH